jgi:hypothetical protein
MLCCYSAVLARFTPLSCHVLKYILDLTLLHHHRTFCACIYARVTQARAVEASTALKTELDTALTRATTAESALTAAKQQHTTAASTAVLQLQAELTAIQVQFLLTVTERY